MKIIQSIYSFARSTIFRFQSLQMASPNNENENIPLTPKKNSKSSSKDHVKPFPFSVTD